MSSGIDSSFEFGSIRQCWGDMVMVGSIWLRRVTICMILGRNNRWLHVRVGRRERTRCHNSEHKLMCMECEVLHPTPVKMAACLSWHAARHTGKHSSRPIVCHAQADLPWHLKPPCHTRNLSNLSFISVSNTHTRVNLSFPYFLFILFSLLDQEWGTFYPPFWYLSHHSPFRN